MTGNQPAYQETLSTPKGKREEIYLLFGQIITFFMGINHGFQCSNIQWITRKVSEHKVDGRMFEPLPSDPVNV